MLYQNIGENNVRHTPLYKGQINICKKGCLLQYHIISQFFKNQIQEKYLFRSS